MYLAACQALHPGLTTYHTVPWTPATGADWVNNSSLRREASSCAPACRRALALVRVPQVCFQASLSIAEAGRGAIGAAGFQKSSAAVRPESAAVPAIQLTTAVMAEGSSNQSTVVVFEVCNLVYNCLKRGVGFGTVPHHRPAIQGDLKQKLDLFFWCLWGL